MGKLLLISSSAFLIFSVGAALWLTQGNQIKNPPISLTRSDQGEGEVTATATWEKAQGAVFTLAFNTHSIDLTAFNVLEDVVLRGGSEEIKPSSWEENPGSSHHRGGKLIFPKVPGASFQLVVKNLAGIEERVLEF